MCYSFDSSIRTASMSAISILYLLTSKVPKFKWLAVSLIGWCAMQLTEAILWYTNPRENCSLLNKTTTMTLIPLTLVLQQVMPLFGAVFLLPENRKSQNLKIFFYFYSLVVLFSVFYYQNIEYDYSNCTNVTESGHLYWSGKYPPTNKERTAKSTQIITYLWGGLLFLQFVYFWKSSSFFSLVKSMFSLFAIPLYGVYLGLKSDSPASIWCYITSFSSVWYSFILFLHNNKLNFFIDV